MSLGVTIMTKEKKTNLLAIPSQDEPCPHVVKQLEELLESAKAGTIRNFFIIAETRNGDPLFIQVGTNVPLTTLGLLEWAKQRWMEVSLMDYEDDKI